MKTINITKARQDLYNIVDEAIDNSEPIQIQGKRGDVVLVSLEDWSAIQETLYLNSIKGFTKSLEEAENEEWFSEDEVKW